MTHIEYPNKNPSHLSQDIVYPPIDSAIPAGSNSLRIDEMEDEQFEQFCWFLLKKDYLLKGCHHTKRNGKKQGGIDLFATEKFNPEKLIVFECKCWRKLTADELKLAIEKFRIGEWSKLAKKFVLIVAQKNIDYLGPTWITHSKRITELGIEAEIWTGDDLTERVQPFPDIVTRFFSPAIAQDFCHEWMQRVAFHERLQQALVDERSEIRELAKNYLYLNAHNKTISITKVRPRQHTGFQKNIDATEEIEQITDSDDSWTMERPWVYINCLKPGNRFYPASVLIKIRQTNTSGFDVQLNQKWLLSKMLGTEGAPLNKQYRPFIAYDFMQGSEKLYSILLQNCQLSLPYDGVEELAYSVDELSNVITEHLVKLENDWDAVDFPFVHQNGLTFVAMCSMPRWLWDLILKFANEHDTGAGKSDWHIFDRNQFNLKILTTRDHPDFDEGYHSIFSMRDNLEGKDYQNSVVILWERPDSFEQFISDKRRWMPCAFALDWMMHKLIPAVKVWYEGKQPIKKFFFRTQKKEREKEFNALWSYATIYDLRERPLVRNQLYKTIGIVETVEKLQYSVNPQARYIYLTTKQIKRILSALILTLKFERGHAPHIATNLGIRNSCNTHEEIVSNLQEKLKQDSLEVNMFALRHMLSAFVGALSDKEDFLSMDQKDEVFQALIPIMLEVDKREFLRRHERWVMQ